MLKQDEISNKIKEERSKQNLTQVQLAKMVGLSNTYLSDIENGRTFPSLKALGKIAISLQLNLADFLSEK